MYKRQHFYCAFAGRRDGKHFVYSYEQIMQKYQDNMRMVDRIPDALSGAMGLSLIHISQSGP